MIKLCSGKWVYPLNHYSISEILGAGQTDGHCYALNF